MIVATAARAADAVVKDMVNGLDFPAGRQMTAYGLALLAGLKLMLGLRRRNEADPSGAHRARILLGTGKARAHLAVDPFRGFRATAAWQGVSRGMGPDEAAARRGHGAAPGANSFGMACIFDRSVTDQELLSTVMMFEPWNKWW